MSETTSDKGANSSFETSAKQTVEVSSLRNLAAQWQTLEYGEQIKKTVLKDETLDRIRKATQLIMESTSKPDDTCGGGNIEKMEWDSLYDFSANVMDNYTKSVDSTLTQLDQLYRVCTLHSKCRNFVYYLILTYGCLKYLETILMARVRICRGFSQRCHTDWKS